MCWVGRTGRRVCWRLSHVGVLLANQRILARDFRCWAASIAPHISRGSVMKTNGLRLYAVFQSPRSRARVACPIPQPGHLALRKRREGQEYSNVSRRSNRAIADNHTFFSMALFQECDFFADFKVRQNGDPYAARFDSVGIHDKPDDSPKPTGRYRE